MQGNSWLAYLVIMELIALTRGGTKLCLEGHMYVKKIAKKDWIRWQCVKQRSIGCKGAVTTDQNVKEVRSLTIHSHPADKVAVEVATVRSTLRDTAKVSKARPMQILSQALLDASNEVRANIGDLNTIKPDPRTQKRRHFLRILLPSLTSTLMGSG
ncbi:uncharacterized protein LOC143038663 isoform X1 [Oratosquilla oratoria]|uniref:uncharacterized protein LOC143038663 isoform X1 n=1 Tax=Oratosquilla oratoria TaxID=337810 RepID=UPI003F7665AB